MVFKQIILAGVFFTCFGMETGIRVCELSMFSRDTNSEIEQQMPARLGNVKADDYAMPDQDGQGVDFLDNFV